MQKIKDVYPGTILEKFFGNKTYIPPVMGPSLRLVVAEAAGAEEDAAGKPLVGGSGRIFDSLLYKAGINRSTLSIINTLPFQPSDNLYPTDPAARVYCNTKDADEIIRFCNEHYVQPVLKAREWTRIDAIGNKSLRLLTGKTEGIMKWRGSPLPLVGEKETRVIGLLHPSYLMRDSGMIPATISDLQKGTQVPPQFYNLQPTLEDVREFASSRTLVFDIETNGFSGSITMVGLCDPTKLYNVTVVPFRGAYIEALKFVFSQSEYLVGQNCISFDLPVLATAGIIPNPKAEIFDIMLMHHLLHPDEPHDLEFISSIYTQMVAWKHLASEDMAFYNACDVDATAQIYLQLRPLLVRFRMMDLYQKLQVPLAKICKQMHDTGIKVDPNRIHTAREKLLIEFHDLEEKLPQELKPYDKTIRIRKPAPVGTIGKSGKPIKFIHVAGAERVVPWQSPKKCEHWLYETLNLPKQIHPKTKAITSSKSALERLAKKFQIPELDALRKLRSLDELLTTFLKEDDGQRQSVTRIHSNFLVHGTATGRLSSSGPNLQNIPAKARFIYVPSFSDWCFVEADFSSLENRLAAWYANDSERLIRLSDPNFNEHRWLASKIYNIPESEITKDMWQYKNGKITNHGCLTGEHEVLTPVGWIPFSQYEGEPLAIWDNGISRWEKPSATIEKTIDENVLSFSGRAFNAVTTLDHKFPVLSTWKGKRYYFKHSAHGLHGSLPITSRFEYENEVFNDLLIQRAVAIQADATLNTKDRATFHVVKARKQSRIEALFNVTGRPCGCHVTGKIYHVDVPKCIIDDNKEFTCDLLYLSSRQRQLFLDEIVQWDGTVAGNVRLYRSTSKVCVDWVQTIAHLSGKQALMRVATKGKGSFGTKPCYIVSINDNQHIKTQCCTVSLKPFSGKVYCVTVSSGNFLCRYKDTIFVSGNCDGAMGPRKLALTHSLPEKVARELILKWREINCKSAQWQDTVGNEAVKKGVLTNAFGRKRWFWSRSGYTEGIRFLPQSTGADICFRAMLGLCYESIGWPEDVAREVCPVLAPLPHPARLVLQVHDSLLIECPLALREQVVECVQKVATQPWHELAGFSIPIDVKVGEANEGWGELHHI